MSRLEGCEILGLGHDTEVELSFDLARQSLDRDSLSVVSVFSRQIPSLVYPTKV